MSRTHPPPHDPETRLPAVLAAFFEGGAGADDELCRVLRNPVAGAVASFLGADGPETDDVIQESLMAVVGYLHRRGGFEGNLVRFAVTVARNRCRNILAWRRRRPHVPLDPLADWIAAPERSPLDAYGEEQVLTALRTSLAELGADCRDLLHALFMEMVSAEAMCERLGLTTVRAVYYRRENCLKGLQLLMNRHLGEAWS
jgi:RNA polymerase sigma factor (sigma-70 family)